MSLNSNVLQEQYYICQKSDCVGNPWPVQIYNFRDLNHCQSHTICTVHKAVPEMHIICSVSSFKALIQRVMQFTD